MAAADRSKAARVRELCRRLKPVMGTKADRIWHAYWAESEDGRAQILDYLELLAAQSLDRDLDQAGADLVPPDEAEAAGPYQLGHVSYNGKSLFPFGLREDEWIQHVGVFGRSGAGKTNLGFLITQELVRHGKPVLIFDWKRNYRDLLNLAGFDSAAVYTVGRLTVPLAFNPLIPPPQTNPKTWLKKLIAVIAHAYLLGNGVLYLLQETIDSVYQDFGVYSGSVERWPTFHDVQATLKARNSPGREAGWLSSAMRALASLTFGDMDGLVNREGGDMQRLLERPVILELDALTQSDKVFFVQAMLLWIHHFRMTTGVREQFTHCCLIEEAHHVLSGERRSLVGGQSVMELTFREIREFGESLVILDQHPSQISMPSLGNTYATFCFNLKHRTDVSAISQAMLLEDDQKQLVGQLPIGQAVARLQGRGRGPFTIQVPEVPIKKGTVTDADVMQHMSRLGLLPVRQQHWPERDDLSHPSLDPAVGARAAGDVTLEHASGDSGDTAAQGSDLEPRELALFADIVRYADSGVAERYKRLGISVRQGQKLKRALLDLGLIMEQVELTARGRIRMIRLTDSGQVLAERTRSFGGSDTAPPSDRTTE